MIVWHGLVVIGFGHSVHLVPLSGDLPRAIPLGAGGCDHFGQLFPQHHVLLVASGTHLFCLDTAGRILWVSDELGIDGVAVNRVEGDTIHGEGEWDPPGGWRPFGLDLRTGMTTGVR